MPRWVGVKDVDQQEFVIALATFLKRSGKIKTPDWVDVVKTGPNRELAPVDEDWYFHRCASAARHIYWRAPIGTGTMRVIFGGKKRRGTKPGRTIKGSGSVARKVLQSLEQVKMINKDTNGGRILTDSGRRDMDRIAAQVKQKALADAMATVKN